MNLFDTISDEIKKAMLAKDKVRLEALRGVKGVPGGQNGQRGIG